MSIVREVERGIALLLLAAVVALGGWAFIQSKRVEVVQEKYQQAAGDARAATVYVVEHKAAIKAREIKNAEVEAALESHRDWSDAPVPGDVADLLRHRSGSTSAVP